MQKYGLDIYIQTVRTEYISKSLKCLLRVCTPYDSFMPIRASSRHGLVGSWVCSDVGAEILSVCVLPSHPHECRRYFI